MAELVQHRWMFIWHAVTTYRSDPYLWQGLGRLADSILADPAFPDRRIAAKGIAQAVEAGQPGLRELFGDRVHALKELGARLTAEGPPVRPTQVLR